MYAQPKFYSKIKIRTRENPLLQNLKVQFNKV